MRGVAMERKSKTLEAVAARMVERREREERERVRLAALKPHRDKTPVEPLVNPFAASHGDYRDATVVDLVGKLGGGRQKTYRVVRNRGVTTVDRWLADGGTGFEEPQARAIDHCRALWARCGSQGKLVADLNSIGGGSSGREHGMEQAEALAQLAQYSGRVPPMYWLIFENVVRNDFATGAAGAVLSNNPSQAVASARCVVGMVASLIAMWRGF